MSLQITGAFIKCICIFNHIEIYGWFKNIQGRMRPIVESKHQEWFSNSQWKCIHRHHGDDGEPGCKSAGRWLRWWQSLNHSAPRAPVWVSGFVALLLPFSPIFRDFCEPLREFQDKSQISSKQSCVGWLDYLWQCIIKNIIIYCHFNLIHEVSFPDSFSMPAWWTLGANIPNESWICLFLFLWILTQLFLLI